jgi:hypothetical protein
MNSTRKVNRITPKEFEDYRVLLELGELTLEGSLGNISETGLCVIMNDNSLLDEIGEDISGIVMSKEKKDKVHFTGKILWYKVQKSNNDLTHQSGIEFSSKINLTQALILKNLTSNQ